MRVEGSSGVSVGGEQRGESDRRGSGVKVVYNERLKIIGMFETHARI